MTSAKKYAVSAFVEVISMAGVIANVTNMINSMYQYMSVMTADISSGKCKDNFSLLSTCINAENAVVKDACASYEDDDGYGVYVHVKTVGVTCTTVANGYLIAFAVLWGIVLIFHHGFLVKSVGRFELDDLRYFVAREKVKDKTLCKIGSISILVLTMVTFLTYISQAAIYKYSTNSFVITSFSFLFNNMMYLLGSYQSKFTDIKKFSMHNDMVKPVKIILDSLPWRTRIGTIYFNAPYIVDYLLARELDAVELKKFGNVEEIREVLLMLQSDESRASDALKKSMSTSMQVMNTLQESPQVE